MARLQRTSGYSHHFSPKHTWKDRDKFILILLRLRYQNNMKILADVFSHLHRRSLAKEGFKNGIPVTSVVAQFTEYKNGGTGSDIYQRFFDLSPDKLHNMFREQYSLIEDCAQELGIKLIPRTSTEEEQPTVSPTSRFHRLRVSVTPSDTTVTTWHPNSDEEDSDDYYTPTEKTTMNRRAYLENETLKHPFSFPVLSPKGFRLNGKDGPYFLYRAFELQHGLKARRFLQDELQIPSPPSFSSSSFLKQVYRHLCRDPDYMSPFLSFAQTPRVALKHAFEKTKNGLDIAVAVFAYDEVEKSAVTRFGPQSGPYLVPIICREHQLFNLPGGYTGRGEFLLWGSVTAEPIAVISGIHAMMVRAIMKTIKHLDFESGLRLSQFIPQDMSNQHVELFLYQLVLGSKIVGRKQPRKNPRYLDFVRGVQMTCLPARARESLQGENTQEHIQEHEAVIQDTQMTDSDSEGTLTAYSNGPRVVGGRRTTNYDFDLEVSELLSSQQCHAPPFYGNLFSQKSNFESGPNSRCHDVPYQDIHSLDLPMHDTETDDGDSDIEIVKVVPCRRKPVVMPLSAWRHDTEDLSDVEYS